jgi:hypothetical protein
VTGLGAFAEAPAGSTKEIAARSTNIPGARNNSKPSFLAQLAEPTGIGMPFALKGSEEAFIDVLRSSAQGQRAL